MSKIKKKTHTIIFDSFSSFSLFAEYILSMFFLLDFVYFHAFSFIRLFSELSLSLSLPFCVFLTIPNAWSLLKNERKTDRFSLSGGGVAISGTFNTT